MKKRPFLMALALLGAIFLFFLVLIYLLAGFMGRTTSFPLGEKVGVVEVLGVITSSKKTIEHLNQFKKDDSVKAIVLRIESPGGGVGPSQEIHDEVRKLAEVKPVVVSMGSVGASGGYYVAVPARRIFANAGTITGSIGVIMEFTSVQELLGKIGLSSQVVKSGQHKDIGSPLREMTEEDRTILQGVIDDVHVQFVHAVAEGRGLPVEEVASLADGRIFTGRQAMEAGLVDDLGNLQDAVVAAAEYAGLDGEPRIVYPPKDKGEVLEYFIQEAVSGFGRGLQERTGTGLQFLWPGVE
ncbi:signal peptide peptidase SppA [uncultured Desulfuromonas sp.]|uniref:signal peptide peptidase SppA n=1 Tax=uncultured Desulfuromonas sp. TaxID=181013 RepID=UPI00262F4D5D|nr:signal peptide peptidase SppA [uncultured Desulfuromonas sp.]